MKKSGQCVSGVEVFDNVWEALGETPEAAANLGARSELMIQITKIVRDAGWTQKEAAKQCGITQPRMNALLRGHISSFSLDALVNIAASLGRKVRVEIEAA